MTLRMAGTVGERGEGSDGATRAHRPPQCRMWEPEGSLLAGRSPGSRVGPRGPWSIAFPCTGHSGFVMDLDSPTVAGAAPESDRLPEHPPLSGCLKAGEL